MPVRTRPRSFRGSFCRAVLTAIPCLLSVFPVPAQEAPAFAEFQINTVTEDDQIRPRIAAAAAGQFVVVWTTQGVHFDPEGIPSPHDRRISARLFDRDGRPLGEELEIVFTHSDNRHFLSAAVARAAEGEFIVVWGENDEVRGKLFAADGTPRDQFEVSEPGRRAANPAVAADGLGNMMVVWRERERTSLIGEIRGRRFDAESEVWEEPFRVSGEESNGTYPQIATDGTDRFLVVWRAVDPETRVVGQRLSNTGEKLGGEFQVNQSPAPFTGFSRGPEDGRLTVAFDPDERFAVVWGNIGPPNVLVVRFFDDEARPMGDEILLGRPVTAPSAAAGPGGELLITSGTAGTYFDRFGLPPRASFPLTRLSGGSLNLTIDSAGRVLSAFKWSGEIYGRILPPPPEGGVFQLADTLERNFTQLVEEEAPVEVTVVRTGGFGPASVGYFLDDVTTTAGEDYIFAGPALLEFEDSETQKTFSFRLREDERREGNELLLIGLDESTGAARRAPTSVVATLYDDDSFRPGEGPLPRGVELRANSRRAGVQRQPRAGLNAVGLSLVAWQSLGQDGDGWGVYARLFGADGQALGDEFRVASHTEGDQLNPAVGASPDGSFVVTWFDRNELRGRRVVADAGSPRLEPEFMTDSPFSAREGYSNEIKFDAAGGFVLVWNSPEPGDFVTARFAADGSALGTGYGFAGGNSSAASSSADGSFLVVWNHFSGFFRGIRFDANNRWIPAGDFRVMPDPEYYVDPRPTIAGNADQPFQVIWEKYQNTERSFDGFITKTGRDIFARRFDVDGRPLGERIPVNSFSPSRQDQPRAATARDGTSIVVWTSQDQLGPSRSDIFARRFRPDGKFLGSRFPINPSRFDQSSPDVAMADNGDFVVAWETQTGPDDFNVFAQRFSGSSCLSAPNVLCFGQGRFRVQVRWKDFDGGEGGGRAVPLVDDTGAFFFFSPDNLDLVVKVLDGRSSNGHFWVFYGSLSNVEFDLTVTDTETGRSKTYSNPAGEFASLGDTRALPAPLDGTSLTPPGGGRARRLETVAATGAACASTETALCLVDERFRVEVEWEDPAGQTGPGRTVPLTVDTGAFWFFSPNNLELAVKVLDAREINGYFWVFYGSLSDVAFTLRVTDTITGAERVFRNPPGRFASLGDIHALPGD